MSTSSEISPAHPASGEGSGLAPPFWMTLPKQPLTGVAARRPNGDRHAATSIRCNAKQVIMRGFVVAAHERATLDVAGAVVAANAWVVSTATPAARTTERKARPARTARRDDTERVMDGSLLGFAQGDAS